MWKHPDHFTHYRVDDGEEFPDRHKSSPVLLHDDHFEADYLMMLFDQESQMLERKLVNLVHEKLLQCPLRVPAKNRHDINDDFDLWRSGLFCVLTYIGGMLDSCFDKIRPCPCLVK